MPMRLTKGLPQPQANTFTFLKQTDISGLIRLLAEHRGHQSDKDWFYRLLYSCLIFDHYSDTYRQRHHVRTILDGWRQLADHQDVKRIFCEIQNFTDVGRIGDISLDLPITSVSPLFNSSAPISEPLPSPGMYEINSLTTKQFIEICWVFRCNLLHDSYDPTTQIVSTIIRNVSRPFAALVWGMVCETPMY